MTYEMALLEARREGRVEGRAEIRGEIALKMLNDGIPVKKILELSELPIERIKEIAAENSIELKAD